MTSKPNNDTAFARPSSTSFWSAYPNYDDYKTAADVWTKVGGNIGIEYGPCDSPGLADTGKWNLQPSSPRSARTSCSRFRPAQRHHIVHFCVRELGTRSGAKRSRTRELSRPQQDQLLLYPQPIDGFVGYTNVFMVGPLLPKRSKVASLGSRLH